MQQFIRLACMLFARPHFLQRLCHLVYGKAKENYELKEIITGTLKEKERRSKVAIKVCLRCKENIVVREI